LTPLQRKVLRQPDGKKRRFCLRNHEISASLL
jgi:hypothetical protein